MSWNNLVASFINLIEAQAFALKVEAFSHICIGVALVFTILGMGGCLVGLIWGLIHDLK